MNYISSHKTQLLDSLESQAFYANLVSVVLGNQGLGKSFLIEQLCNRVKDQVVLVKVDAEASLTQFQLTEEIKKQLNYQQASLEAYLSEKTDSDVNSQRIFLSVDNAHLMPEEHLDFLLGLARIQDSNQQCPLYLFLAGEPNLALKLNDTDVLQQYPETCVVFELQTFELDETKLLIADFQSLDLTATEALYDEQKFNFFWQLSKGNPGKLHRQLMRWLDETEANKEITQETNSRRQYLLFFAYSIAALILILVLIFQDEINQMITSKEDTLVIDEKKQIPVKADESLVEINLTQEKKRKKLEEFDFKKEQKKEFNQSVNSALESKEMQIENKSFEQDNLSANEKTSVKEKKPIQDKQPIQQSVVNEEFNKEPEKSVKPQIKNQSQPEKKSEFNFSKDELNLLAQDEAGFILQWIALSEYKSALAFRDKHPLKERILIFRRKNKKGIIYLLVSDYYANRQLADAARAKYMLQGYPESWIKPMKTVKEDILSLKDS